MSDTRRRWQCGCGSVRYAVYAVDMYWCQGCRKVYKWNHGMMWATGITKEVNG